MRQKCERAHRERGGETRALRPLYTITPYKRRRSDMRQTRPIGSSDLHTDIKTEQAALAGHNGQKKLLECNFPTDRAGSYASVIGPGRQSLETWDHIHECRVLTGQLQVGVLKAGSCRPCCGLALARSQGRPLREAVIGSWRGWGTFFKVPSFGGPARKPTVDDTCCGLVFYSG